MNEIHEKIEFTIGRWKHSEDADPYHWISPVRVANYEDAMKLADITGEGYHICQVRTRIEVSYREMKDDEPDEQVHR